MKPVKGQSDYMSLPVVAQQNCSLKSENLGSLQEFVRMLTNTAAWYVHVSSLYCVAFVMDLPHVYVAIVINFAVCSECLGSLCCN